MAPANWLSVSRYPLPSAPDLPFRQSPAPPYGRSRYPWPGFRIGLEIRFGHTIVCQIILIRQIVIRELPFGILPLTIRVFSSTAASSKRWTVVFSAPQPIPYTAFWYSCLPDALPPPAALRIYSPIGLHRVTSRIFPVQKSSDHSGRMACVILRTVTTNTTGCPASKGSS